MPYKQDQIYNNRGFPLSGEADAQDIPEYRCRIGMRSDDVM